MALKNFSGKAACRAKSIRAPMGGLYALVELCAISLLTFLASMVLIAALLTGSSRANPNTYPIGLIQATPQRPELLKGIVAQDPGSDAQFRVRLKESIRAPITEDDFSSKLKSQGFRINDERNTAYFTEIMVPCVYMWQVTWIKDRSRRIINVKGRHATHCS